MDIHVDGRVYHGSLFLQRRLKKKDFETPVEQINDQLIDLGREDFILTVYQGKEIGFYSDTIDEAERRHHPATKADLDEIHISLRRVLGRHQDVRGQLNEYAACAYFESFGYKAHKANPKLDARKIDVVATRADETIYAQVKLGSITPSEMRQVAMSVADLVTLEPHQAIVGIFATSFPSNSEFIRRELEKEFGLIVMCIQLYQVLHAVPEYKRMLKGE